jgi:hypothetical protein
LLRYDDAIVMIDDGEILFYLLFVDVLHLMMMEIALLMEEIVDILMMMLLPVVQYYYIAGYYIVDTYDDAMTTFILFLLHGDVPCC